MAKWMHVIIVLLLSVTFTSCGNQKPQSETSPTLSFNPENLIIPDKGGRKVRGQVLYLPVYSNIPYLKESKYDLSAFLAVHNTDLRHEIKITKVYFFNTQGRLVKSYVSSEQKVTPLSTVIFEVSRDDKSGTGANFLVEWIADQQVNEPLVESVMKDLKGNVGISFLSTGRVIREIQ